MGLPGSGKTYLAQTLHVKLNAAWYNADKIRSMANDWDFSNEGRKRQAKRMRVFADFEKENGRKVLCDFVCPTEETRKLFSPDITIWMDTIDKGRYEDTNKLFEPPKDYHFRINKWKDNNDEYLSEEILKLDLS